MIGVKSYRMQKVTIHAVFIAICLLCLIPLITVITISVSKNASILKDGYRVLPVSFNLSAYRYIFEYPKGLFRAYGNSAFVAGIGCVLSLFVCSMFSYAIARRDFAFRRSFTFYIVFTMLFNGGIVSSYIVVTNYLKLQDNIWALILPYLVVPMHVIILRTFFAAIPKEIIESAKIDGAGELYTYYKIALPLSKPALASVGLLILLLYWNDWWLGLLFINNPKHATLQIMLNAMMQNIEFLRTTALGASNVSASDFPTEAARMAMCVAAAGPMIVVLPFFQKYFVKGLTVGSVKG